MRKKYLLMGLMMFAILLTSCGNAGGKEILDSDVDVAEDTEDVSTIGNADFDDSLKTDIPILLDNVEINVTMYEDYYTSEPNSEEQKISVYVPEGATMDSPIILCVNNAGWKANSYSARVRIQQNEDGTLPEYSSSDDADKLGAIFSRNFVMVSYGCRSRTDEPVDGKYKGHSPATVVDTKAVIRYLRNNAQKLPAGNTDKIIITGTSGGGALSTVIAASGNSTDYFEGLYEIGAAGIEKNGENYVSTIGDDVFGVIAYCPITDLGNADAAYEWTYGETRSILEGIDFNSDPDKDAKIHYSEEQGTVNKEASELLSSQYENYVDSLNLKMDDGTALTSDNLADAIAGLMEDEIEESMNEIGIEQMNHDLRYLKSGNEAIGPVDWLVFNDDGSYTYDYAKHLTWVASNTKLKVVCAFSNAGLPWAKTNEDSLFGTEEYEYCAFESYSWDNDSVVGNGCGVDDTGLTWEEYMQTDEGKELVLQLRMTNAIAYLNDNQGDDAGEKAPFWYVRYGMNDRDSSFALETILRYSISNQSDIDEYSFEFTWLYPHMGDYEINEAYSWLDDILDK